MKSNKGFTLIELLVVIAIIGILSSVVLASLNTARSKASDNKTKAQIKNVVTAAELYFNAHGNYGTNSFNTCPTIPCTAASCPNFWDDAKSGLFELAKPSNYPGTLTCYHTNTGVWVIQAQLSGSNNYWCVDNTQTALKPCKTTSPLVNLYCSCAP